MNEFQADLFDKDPPAWEIDAMADWLVARIVFAQPPFGPYDYRVPDYLRNSIQPGARVNVRVGRGNRSMIGYCSQLVSPQSKAGTLTRDVAKLKELEQLLDSNPLINDRLLELAHWISDHYLAPLGSVIEAVVPQAVRDRSGTREIKFLYLADDFLSNREKIKLTQTQQRIVNEVDASDEMLTIRQAAEAAGCTEGPVRSLLKKGILESTSQRIRLRKTTIPAEAPGHDWDLNPQQKLALELISKCVDQNRFESFLIHGVTGSGKTEIYIRAIQKVVSFGRQAIVLVPEISLTPQTRQRFRQRFDRVAVLHSHMSAVDRAWFWEQISRGVIDVVIGARSAIFAPLPNLGLIVIDEEHDYSFKQNQSPRYHARDVANWRAQRERIPLILGSATPSVETWFKAVQPVSTTPAIRLINLNHRVLDRPLPDVATLDLRVEFKSRVSRGAISRQLHSAMQLALNDGGQIILLLNRRGFATSIQCPACGFVLKCKDCSISLTHHRDTAMAVCHYCDYQVPVPDHCPDCQFTGIRLAGFGTQRLEQEVNSRFKNYICARMDTDTMQKPGSHEATLTRFREGKIDILLGTQMIAKGLDFPNVTLVGVINADTALHLPDFRAAEKTFALVTQVAGRSGRGDKGGRVLVQTFSPENPAIVAATHHNYEQFVNRELPNRKAIGYPPFRNLARLIVRGKNVSQTRSTTEMIMESIAAESSKAGAQLEWWGPAEAPIPKLRGQFRFHCMIFGPLSVPMQPLLAAGTEHLAIPEDVQWIIDVDPLEMM
jgi:primosomal protein N' (replication factor Y) (superfamily II helicase)